MVKVIGYIMAIILFIAAAFGLWMVGKKINYALSYESMVRETVEQMVKEECLKK